MTKKELEDFITQLQRSNFNNTFLDTILKEQQKQLKQALGSQFAAEIEEELKAQSKLITADGKDCWVYILRGRSTSIPDGYYKITEKKEYYEQNEILKGTPKIGDWFVPGSIRTFSVYTATTPGLAALKDVICVSWPLGEPGKITPRDLYSNMPELLSQLDSTGQKLHFTESSEVIAFFNNGEHLEDNGVHAGYIADWVRHKNIIQLRTKRELDYFNGPFYQTMYFHRGGGKQPVPKARVSHDKKLKAYDIVFSYGKSEWAIIESIITLIKGSIPVAQRAYDPKTKTWTIAAESYVVVKKIFDHINLQVEEVRPISADGFFYEDVVNAKGPVTKDTLSIQLKKLLGVTDDVLANDTELKKAYRKKALELHPDRNNGDGSKMSALNEVYNAYIGK